MTKEVNSGIQISPAGAYNAIKKALKAGRVPMLHGSPAIGKSSIVHKIAADFDLQVIDLRLSQCEPQDLLGFPFLDKERNKSGYVPMETFPIKGDIIPEGKKGWLLFLDELPSATPSVQAASYKLILDRMVGVYPLHEQVYIVGAGNLESDNAVVHPMSTALQTRLVHLELAMDAGEWIDWAMDNKLDHRIIDYIQFKPDNLYTFSPDHTDKTYASPRTWHFTNDLLKACDSNVNDPDFLILAAGSITPGIAQEFIQFCAIYKELPKLSDIMMAPTTVKVPGEPSILYALSGSIGNFMTKDNADKLMPYIERMPIEFRVVTVRYVVKLQGREILAAPAISKWVAKEGTELFK